MMIKDGKYVSNEMDKDYICQSKDEIFSFIR